MSTPSIELKEKPVEGSLWPMLQFTSALMKSNLKNGKVLALSLGLPVFMLFTFWITTGGPQEEEFDLMVVMFPAIVALAVMLAGLTQATRITQWREQGIFQRFALTSVPLPALVLGAAVAQRLRYGVRTMARFFLLFTLVPLVELWLLLRIGQGRMKMFFGLC